MEDMNVVYRESDISPHPEFWKRQGDQIAAEGDKCFGRTTDNERRRLRHILEFGELSDTFTPPSGRRLKAKWTFRGEGKFHGKGIKLNYIFTDDTIFLSGRVKSSKILANGRDRDGFMGSDHAPMMCELHPRWRIKQSNFIRHYDAREIDLESVAAMFTKTGAKGPKSIEIDEALYIVPGTVNTTAGGIPRRILEIRETG
jgi:hypothetical protein